MYIYVYIFIYLYLISPNMTLTHSVWALVLGCVDISNISYFSCQH